VLIVFSAYILFNLAYYKKAKKIAREFSIYLMEDALGFPDHKAIKKIPYRDIKISKVKKKNGNIVGIHLKTTFGQSIMLQGLENMNDLYESIIDRLQH
jgi:hypothetical protein